MANVSSSNGLEKRPKLRFPGFDEPWQTTLLSSVFAKNTQKNTDGRITNVICNSAKQGLIPQREYFDKNIANSDNTNGYYIIEENDFVYNPRKSADAPYGPISSYKYTEAGIVSPLYLCFRAKKEINPAFFEWYFRSSAWHRYVYMSGDSGARHDRVSIKDDTFFAMPINIPSAHEQAQIAIFLERIEQRIEMHRALVDSLKKYKRGLFNQIFSAISKSSQCRKLRELVRVSGGKTPSMSNSLYWNGDIVWISSKDMKSSRISGSELKITNLALNEMTLYHPGTLLLVARSGILKHSLPLAILEVDATINQDIKALQVHGCNAFYLYYAILSQEDTIIRTLVKTGTTVQSLMMDSFLNIEIPTPDIDQQQRIIDKLAKLEKYVEVQEKELSLLSQMRNGLLQQLFI